jgi:hypothetical protein
VSSTYCPLPWIHLGTHPHGGVTPCCISDMTAGLNRARSLNADGSSKEFYNLNEHSIDTHMNSDYYKAIRLDMLRGDKPRACMRCYEEEGNGIRSKRQWEAAQYPSKDHRWASDVTSTDGYVHTDLSFVELRLGNTCNVQCRTCNPASSSKWRRDYEEVVEKLEFVNDGYTWLDHKKDFRWPEDQQFYEDLFNSAPNMEVLYINGGEPTLIKAHWAYIRRLVDSGRSKNIILWYNINMTNIPDYAVELWREFKECRVCASIDDIGARNHLIRWPTMWADVRDNLNTILAVPELTVRITQTVSAYNYLSLVEFHTWAPVPVDMNFVYDPVFLSPAVLPPCVRDVAHERIRAAWGNEERLTDCLNRYNISEWDSALWEQFCRYNDLLDEQRKSPRTWREVLHEVIEICDANGVQHRFDG